MAPNATAIRPPIWAISHAVSAPYFPMCLPPPFYFTKMKKAPTPIRDGAFFRSFLSWRRPTFPHSYPCSIIGPARLNYRVRDGNGCDPRGVTTRKFETRERVRRGPAENYRERDNRRLAYKHASIERTAKQACCLNLPNDDLGKFYGQAERAISTGQLERIAALPPPAYQGRSLRPPFLSRRSGIGRPYLRASFMLRCIQHLSLPDFATERCRWRDSSYTRGLSIPVLSY